jgi:hypothetical protein
VGQIGPQARNLLFNAGKMVFYVNHIGAHIRYIGANRPQLLKYQFVIRLASYNLCRL